MSQWKEGDRVRIISRPVTVEDKKENRYFEHMANVTGTVQNIYADDQIAVKADIESLNSIARDVHKIAVKRMREKFLGSIGEEQKKTLTTEELNFNAHYMLLVKGSDLEKI